MSGFDVNDAVEIENIDEVKQVKPLIPATSNVRLLISKVAATTSKSKEIGFLALSLKIIDGIEVLNEATGQNEIKYKGAMATQFPQKLMFWVKPEYVQAAINNPANTTNAVNYWKNKQYLVDFKMLLIACGIDPKLEEFKVDGKLNVDALISEISKKEVIGNILQTEEKATSIDPETHKKVKTGLGTYQNEVKNLRKAQ